LIGGMRADVPTSELHNRMGSATNHNEFIRDTEDLFSNHILPNISPGSYQNVFNACSIYKEKWKTIFTLKKEKAIDDTISNRKQKILKLYQDLKNSIQFNTIQHTIDLEAVPSVDAAIEELQNILLFEKRQQAELQVTQYHKGFILLQLKILTSNKKAFKSALGKIVSYEHACKLIRFYNSCTRYL
jgi:hypothetical protein